MTNEHGAGTAYRAEMREAIKTFFQPDHHVDLTNLLNTIVGIAYQHHRAIYLAGNQASAGRMVGSSADPATSGDSGAEARAEPSERAEEVREELRDSPYAGQFTVGSVSDPRPLIVRCAACRGTGQPTPHAQAYLKESVCSGCKGAGVHRV